MLLPAPVELPCRAAYADGPLCDRDASMLDVMQRFGAEGSRTANVLYLLCGGEPRPGQVQSCTRTVREPMTIHAAGGHMHLLGPRDQRGHQPRHRPRAGRCSTSRCGTSTTRAPATSGRSRCSPATPCKVTCKHVQWLRDQLPSFEGQPDRYVVWGEGTTDEMCLGMLQVSKP